MSRIESQLKFAQTHEWADVDSNGVATIGISSFAIEQLNDLVFMELPKVGKTLVVADEFGEVESVKAVSPLYSPVAGEVVEVNADVPDNLEKLNEDPYEFGWLIKVKLTSGHGTDHLMDFASYSAQCSDSH
jgi:glycine cleavage system H protein